MKNKLKSAKSSSKSAAAPQSKTHGAAGASAQTPEALLKLVRSYATWNITSVAGKALHRTLDGQLIIVDREGANTGCEFHYDNAQPVSYAEACKWIQTSGNRWKPEVLLQFHGIIDPARAAVVHHNTRPGRAGGSPAPIQPEGDPGIITCVWVGSDGSEYTRVDFPCEIFAHIERAASKLRISLQQFFERAIRNYISSARPTSQRRPA
jgi:hypothetical protein